MTMTLNGSGTITGLSAGGLPDASITASDLASGVARSNFGAGAVLQVQSTTLTTVFSSSSATFTDVTGLSVSITPSSASSRILIFASVSQATSTTSGSLWQLVRNSTAIDIGTAGYTWPATGGYYTESGTNASNAWSQPSANFLDSPATTSAVTYKVQGRSLSGTFYINRRGAGTDLNLTSSITVMEIAA